MPHLDLNIFSKEEEGFYFKTREWRDKVLMPVTTFLAHKKITPDLLTYAGLFMMVLFVYCFTFNPWLSFICLLFHFLFDVLDGALSRYLQKENPRGFLLDIASDNLGFFAAFLTFLYFGLMDPFWSAVYLLNYTILVFLTIILRSLHIHFFPVFRSKYVIYGFFFIWLVSGQNYFNPVIVFFALYMTVSNLFLFHKLRCSIS
jgi:phosphatidylglycerophosphate synthase